MLLSGGGGLMRRPEQAHRRSHEGDRRRHASRSSKSRSTPAPTARSSSRWTCRASTGSSCGNRGVRHVRTFERTGKPGDRHPRAFSSFLTRSLSPCHPSTGLAVVAATSVTRHDPGCTCWTCVETGDGDRSGGSACRGVMWFIIRPGDNMSRTLPLRRSHNDRRRLADRQSRRDKIQRRHIDECSSSACRRCDYRTGDTSQRSDRSR